MIFVTDKGRMANNIFQYGQLYAWGREHGRKTMSMRFAYKYPDFKIAHTKYHNVFLYIAAKMAAKLHLIPTIVFDDKERGQIETLCSHKHVLVTGWNVRFADLFEKYKDEIIGLFEFMPKIQQNIDNIIGISTEKSIKLGVHIRRGDYRTWCRGKYYYDDNQYINVIKQFTKLYQGQHVDIYICSNDPELDILKYQNNIENAKVYYPSGTPTNDLCLLSKCDYLIGPPSTFTLIASMYHNTPLYWISDIQQKISLDSFYSFDYQARHFDDYFIP